MFQFLINVFVLANSADHDEMLHKAAFYQGLHCLAKYSFKGFYKGLIWHIHVLNAGCMISIVTEESDTAWKTVQILIIWLCQKPADLDIRCFHKKIYPGSAGQRIMHANMFRTKTWCDKGSCKMSDCYLYI